MEKPVDKIQCLNETCLASNPRNERFCSKCGLPILKRYLWAIGNSQRTFEPGELIGDRYLCKQPNIFLDTKPGKPPAVPEEIPRLMQPYLKLFVLRPNIPQIFGKLLEDEDIWLLEYGTIPLTGDGEPEYTQLLPSMRELWSKASPLQQLNWLLQIVRLWQPLKSQGVVSSLFNEDLIRINGGFVQLRQLEADQLEIRKLKDLVPLWRRLLEETSPKIKALLEELCRRLEAKEISQYDELLVLLDGALKNCQSLYDWSYSVYAETDAGPSREHNEDACYPDNKTLVKNENQKGLMAIVCDGIGGQESGEIASGLAVNSLVQNINESLSKAEQDNISVYQILKEAIYKANDLICYRNDQEDRSERQRMGTTLVMGLARNNEVHLAHLGDSRVYWITSNSCHQLTVDDDIASREVRLGYVLYRNAIQHANSGALTQALGTAPSTSLYPTIQRQIPTQDCLLLLTSDGLSDYDRIEQYWESELLPLLEGEKELTEVGENLVLLANSKNGHDNTTIILVHCQVQPKINTEDLIISLPESNSSMDTSPDLSLKSNNNQNNIPTQKSRETVTTLPKKKNNTVLLSVLSVLILGGAGILFYLSNNISQSNNVNPTPTNSSIPTATPTPP